MSGNMRRLVNSVSRPSATSRGQPVASQERARRREEKHRQFGGSECHLQALATCSAKVVNPGAFDGIFSADGLKKFDEWLAKLHDDVYESSRSQIGEDGNLFVSIVPVLSAKFDELVVILREEFPTAKKPWDDLKVIVIWLLVDRNRATLSFVFTNHVAELAEWIGSNPLEIIGRIHSVLSTARATVRDQMSSTGPQCAKFHSAVLTIWRQATRDSYMMNATFAARLREEMTQDNAREINTLKRDHARSVADIERNYTMIKHATKRSRTSLEAPALPPPIDPIFIRALECDLENNPGSDLKFFVCPLSRRVMRDPVSAMDGRDYDREYIEKHLETSFTSPIPWFGEMEHYLVPARALRSQMIDAAERALGRRPDSA